MGMRFSDVSAKEQERLDLWLEGTAQGILNGAVI
jgi:hypothetical protein